MVWLQWKIHNIPLLSLLNKRQAFTLQIKYKMSEAESNKIPTQDNRWASKYHFSFQKAIYDKTN